MYALSAPPPTTVELEGAEYRLVRVFKHDFLAATCLYEAAGAAKVPSAGRPAKVVVKFLRMRPLLALPMGWAGRFLAEHEEHAYRALAGVEGIPRWLGRLGPAAFAVEYIDSTPLSDVGRPPAGFFDSLGRLFNEAHARGVAFGDANKRSNILVGPGGRAFLIDFQLALRRRDDLPWPLGAISRAAFRYMAGRDVYHVCKHKRRMSPHELTGDEMAVSRRRDPLHALHHRLVAPWRRLRRFVFQRLARAGLLTSPTEHIEDPDQAEKFTLRKK